MARRFELTDEAARQMRDDMLAGAVPLISTGTLTFPASREAHAPTPLVRLDASDRLDIKDVFRVIQDEGIQTPGDAPIRSVYVDGQGYMEIPFVISDPVTCSFRFVLCWPEHQPFFDAIEQHGQLFFTVRDVDEEGVADSELLSLNMDRPEVLEALAEWRDMGK